MPPSFLRFPICCCAKEPRTTSGNQEKNSALAIPVNGKHRLTIPKVAVNGRVITSARSRLVNSSEYTVIDMPEDFITARTSRELCNGHLSMKELMREVRREEGLQVTPRHLQNDEKRSRLSSPRGSDGRPPPKSSPSPQALDAKQLAQSERARRAVFDAEGDITARTASSATSSNSRKSTACSVATISGGDHLVLPHTPPSASAMHYITALPQMLFAIIGMSLAWLANLFNFVLR